MFNDISDIIVSVLAAVIVTLLLIIARQASQILTQYLQKKQAEADAADDEAASKAYSLALTVLESITQTTVSRIEATQAAAVRKAVKAGQEEFTELTKLSDEAYEDIIEQMSPYVMEALEQCVSNTETFIRGKIEEVLPKVKADYKKLTSTESGDDAQGVQQDGETQES